MITEDYVSFEVAKLLKEKGFNEKVICYYDDGGSLNLNKFVEFQCCNQGYGSGVFAAPTLQMVCKWLREVHGLDIDISIEYTPKKVYYYSILKKTVIRDIDCLHNETNFKSYEQAVEVAIQYCLEKLI